MIIRGFLSNKRHLIYILLLAIVLFLIPIFYFMNQHRVEYYNKTNYNTYIEFVADYSEYENISSLKYVDEIILGFSAGIDSERNIRIFQSHELNNNELIGDTYIFRNYDIGDTINLNGNSYSFLLKDKRYGDRNNSYISYETFFLINNSSEVIYNVYLNDWTKTDKVINNINDFAYRINVYNENSGIYNYGLYDFFYYIFKLILSAIALIVLIFIITSVYNEEKEKCYLYKCLGYTKWEILKVELTKISAMLLISFIIFGIIASVFFFI